MKRITFATPSHVETYSADTPGKLHLAKVSYLFTHRHDALGSDFDAPHYDDPQVKAVFELMDMEYRALYDMFVEQSTTANRLESSDHLDVYLSELFPHVRIIYDDDNDADIPG